MSAITAIVIAAYQHARNKLGIANRTINMDVAVLSRVLKFCRRWKPLAEHVRPLPEHQRPIGRALTREEQARLFETAASHPEWEHVYQAAVVAANTSMRRVEVMHLKRRDVDIFNKTVTIRRSKNESSHRIIPLNDAALKALSRIALVLDGVLLRHRAAYRGAADSRAPVRTRQSRSMVPDFRPCNTWLGRRLVEVARCRVHPSPNVLVVSSQQTRGGHQPMLDGGNRD